ncbi:MAG: GntR family transcriptional regulator [Nitrosospira sp. 56-18]|jgi:putative oxidoreductase|nr:DoxX family protein [Nitrosospira sp.]OJY07839.1 MAG: GntR family transcriptional regulator [Nitrosospira sp. 56-18]
MHNSLFIDSLGKLVLRIAVGVMILMHGIYKIQHPESLDFISNMLADIDLPPAVAYGVYVGEVVGPLMMILGIFSRMGGLIVVVNMIFAIVLAHQPQLYDLTSNGGWAIELQGLFLLGSLAVALLGSGRFAAKPD